MPDDTRIGGPSARFPTTRRSVVALARSRDGADRTRAFETVAATYWKPVYKYIRARWGKSNEDAKDLTQEFFAQVIEKGFLDGYDPAKSRLRTFLRICVDGVVANHARAQQRIKRGGDVLLLPLDFDAAEKELAGSGFPIDSLAAPAEMEKFFEREWVRSLFSLAVEEFRAECETRGKFQHFRLFERYDLEDGDERPSYQDLAHEFGLAVTDVTNYLAFARREFRGRVLATLREMTASEDEFRREARALLGVDPK